MCFIKKKKKTGTSRKGHLFSLTLHPRALLCLALRNPRRLLNLPMVVCQQGPVRDGRAHMACSKAPAACFRSSAVQVASQLASKITVVL